MRLPFRRRRGSGLRLPANRSLLTARPVRPRRPAAPGPRLPGSGPSKPIGPRADETAIGSLTPSEPRQITEEPDPEYTPQVAADEPEPAQAAPGRRPGRGVSLLPHALPQEISLTLGRTVAATGLTPNMLTVAGLLGSGGAAALAAYGHFWQAGLVMLAAGAFDLLDGAVARATGRATTWGAIFDAVSDRLGEFAVFLGLLVWFSAPAHFDRDAVILIGVSIGGAMLVSYTRSKAGEYGVRIRTGLGTRFERVVILAIGLFANEVVAVLWILAVLTNLTALQRWGVTWWALRNYAEPPGDGADTHDEDPA